MNYVYIFGSPVGEESLCQLEMRMFFGEYSTNKVLMSPIKVDPSRSPFMQARLSVEASADQFEELVELVKEMPVSSSTFKIVSLHRDRVGDEPKWTASKRQPFERTLGLAINGEVDLNNPEMLYGFVHLNGKWLFGELVEGKAVWLKHQERPHEYSTALSTRNARAIVNIAAPKLNGVRIIDPCCGIGTVLIEACSMGHSIVGRDMNWAVASGSRKNLAHFGYDCEVVRGPIEEAPGHYDVAIIDMPYNVFTHSSEEAKSSIIQSARKLANRVVFISSEKIAHIIEAAGFTIADKCTIQKQKFIRTVFVCK